MTSTDTDERGAPEIVRDLFGAVLSLVRSTARMFGAEAREVTRLERELAVLKDATSVPPKDDVLALLEKR